MNYIEALTAINDFLKKEAEKNNIEYYIINNTLGKNLILIENLNKLNNGDKIIEELQNNYKQYISEIISEDEETEEFINKIKSICPRNSYIHKNISYSAWQNETEDTSYCKYTNNIITGYSFKGGMGRSQSLAYLALFISLLGKKVVVLDCDFEAPGIASILKEKKGNNEKLGIVDYLIDINLTNKVDLEKYYYKVELANNLIVFSSGIEYEPKSYINRLSKIDFNSDKFFQDFCMLIENIGEEIKPDYIFIDLRAGISESNGKILQKISTKNLLFFNNDEQNLIGLEMVLNQILSVSNLKLNSKYYIVNSLIRDYNSQSAKIKINNFNNFIKNNYKIYQNKVYNLSHETKFLDNSFKELYQLTTNNVALYQERSDEIKELVEVLSGIDIKLLERMVRDLEGNSDKKSFSKLMMLKLILEAKEKNVGIAPTIEKRYINVFLFDILKDILLI